jgi:peptide/nickel transport system substrate-binding protein
MGTLADYRRKTQGVSRGQLLQAGLATGSALAIWPNVKTIFTRNPDYFRPGLPYMDGVEWLVLEHESTGLAMYRTGQIDAGPWYYWAVRQPDLDSFQQSHPHLHYRDSLANNVESIALRTDKPPFTDVRVRHAISLAVDRQVIIDAVYMRGEPSPAVPSGLAEWSLPIEQLGEEAKYSRYDPPGGPAAAGGGRVSQGLYHTAHRHPWLGSRSDRCGAVGSAVSQSGRH